MRVAVIGAGIVGVTSAYELARDGHEVTVFERRSSVAAETSFANAGVVAPGYVTPWAAPGMPWKVLHYLFSRHAPLRIGGLPDSQQLAWLWRWWRACAAAAHRANRSRMQRLAQLSQHRLNQLTTTLGLEYEQVQGYLVLLRSDREAAMAQPGLSMLKDAGVAYQWVDAARCREIEPGLNPDMRLSAGVHLPHDGVGNCRQFAHLLKAEAQKFGARFRFLHEAQRVEPGVTPKLQLRQREVEAGSGPESGGVLREEAFDAVLVCAALGAVDLLRPLGVTLPLQAVHGYSITAPLRLPDEHARAGPRSGLMDERFKVAITRLGSRVRVAGSAELFASDEKINAAALRTLYKVLEDWFPGVIQMPQAQRWKGARPMLPDGPPVLGASGAPGVWLNLGHGSSGWALSCGSACVLADLIGGRGAAIDIEGLGIERLR